METILSLEKVYLFLGVFLVVCLLVITAIMLDLWDGVHTARKTNQRVHSHKLRVTIEKISEYFRFVLIGFLVDCLGLLFTAYPMPFIAILFGVGLITVEVKSMFEHASRRRSHVTQMPEIIRGIVECVHDKDAKRLVEQIQSLSTPTH